MKQVSEIPYCVKCHVGMKAKKSQVAVKHAHYNYEMGNIFACGCGAEIWMPNGSGMVQDSGNDISYLKDDGRLLEIMEWYKKDENK